MTTHLKGFLVNANYAYFVICEHEHFQSNGTAAEERQQYWELSYSARGRLAGTRVGCLYLVSVQYKAGTNLAPAITITTF